MGISMFEVMGGARRAGLGAQSLPYRKQDSPVKDSPTVYDVEVPAHAVPCPPCPPCDKGCHVIFYIGTALGGVFLLGLLTGVLTTD